MKTYEVFVILSPRMGEEEVSLFTENLQKLLNKEGGQIKESDVKLNQKLSYPIKNQRSGHMISIGVQTEEARDIIKILNEEFKTNENVMRNLVISRQTQQSRKKEPVSVIDQLRDQQRQDAVLPQSQSTAESPVSNQEVVTQKPGADVQEIDKKIEEILK